MSNHAAAHERVPLLDHVRPPRSGRADVGRTDAGTQMQVTIVLRRVGTGDASSEAPADRNDISAVLNFCRDHGLAVLDVSEERRSVTISGTADLFERAFDVELIDVEHEGKRYRRFSRPISVPASLCDIVVAVFGLRSRPGSPRVRVHHANSTTPFWTIRELHNAYDFPAEADGTGQVIGLIELGGGFDPNDLSAFFSTVGLAVPPVRVISVDGAANRPANPEAILQFLDVVEGRRSIDSVDAQLLADAQATIEVTMDIEIAGALAPGAQLAVYMAPATEQGIFNALSRAVSKEDPLLDVLSMSWGEAEPRVSDAYISAINDVLQDAAKRGITLCASSGDAGSLNDSPDEFPCVNFPASSPFALACGGSTVLHYDSALGDEVVWNCGPHGISAATGGGVSRKFPTPEWQRRHAVPLAPGDYPGRGVPDVAGPADPHNGCAILVGGMECASAGTSAVAPFWAALVARFNQMLGKRCGHVNPMLYELASSQDEAALRAIVEGSNGHYQAGPGWNPCTGLGTPRGRALAAMLRAAAQANANGVQVSSTTEAE